MKTIVAALCLIVVCLYLYNQDHPFGRPSIPSGHHYAAEGVYFLRTARTITGAGGPVQWKQGQQVFADRLSKEKAPKEMVLVTDGTNSTPVPSNMLSEDVQEGEALRQVEIDAQAQAAAAAAAQANQARFEQQRVAQAKAEQERLRALEGMRPPPAATPTPTPKFGHTALDEKPTPVPYRYYPTPYYPTPYYH